MKKLTILLFIALVLTSCSSGGTKTEETDSFQVDTKQDIEVNVTYAAREKMNSELKKTDIDNAMYKVGFGYSSAGWGTPIYNLVLEEHEINYKEWNYYEVNDIIIAVPVSLKEYLSGLKIDFDDKNVLNEFLVEPVYWQLPIGFVKILTTIKNIIFINCCSK